MRPYDRCLTVAEIEAALHALLTAIEAEECRRIDAPRSCQVTLTASPFSELAKTEPIVWKVEDLTRDPIGRACREQIKALGRMLFRVAGSTDAMRESLDRVAALNPAREGKRAVVMDKWWSGAGSQNDMWCP